jgi:hypothetical protein
MAVSKSRQPAIKPAVKIVSIAEGRPTLEVVAMRLVMLLVLVIVYDNNELRNVA